MESLVALLFGLLIGSFLNVAVHRWPRGRSVVKPRSHCVRCRKMIAWYDNLPVVSYALLGGRCRHCGKHISVRYPIVELLTGVVFLAFVQRLGPTWMSLKMCVLGAILIALMFCDLEKRLLPDELTLGGTMVGLVFAIVAPIRGDFSEGFLGQLPPVGQSLVASALGAGLPAGLMWLAGYLYEKIRHREGLGFGDVKLLAMVGSFLGLSGALATVIYGSVAGAVLGLIYIKITRQDTATYELPFGTFLGAAALVLALISPVSGS